MKPISVSVIIPIFNAEKFLRRCLDSVLHQTISDIEAICINDGSTDHSDEILAKYAARDARIKVISKKNAGVSAARNDGIAAASGAYIHFLDADDFIDGNYYEKMLNAAIAATADMAVSGFAAASEYTRGMAYEKNSVATGLYQILKKTNALNDSYIWRYVFRRGFILENKLKFRTDLVAQEDTVFLLGALKLANRVAIAGQTMYHYVYNDASALNCADPAHQQKVNADYKIGKEFRRNFARENHVMRLWRLRKLRRLPIIGNLFK